jgi:NAD(P)-dependent dehydrogenase (short-subunit alcohol dehydrogenase family)
MDLHLQDKVVVVTGAGSRTGYGRAIALAFAGEGCHLVLADVDREGIESLVEEIEALGRKALAVRADVTDREQVASAVSAALERLGRIDVLVNNAGASSLLRPFAEMNRADWDLDIQVNLYGQMNMAQAVLPHMMSRRYGRIINVSGGQGIPNISVYGAAKAGVEAFTRALAKEVFPWGIVVNCVAPGLGATGLTAKAPPEFMARYVEDSPLKRLCSGEDVAPVVLFLASDVCSYMVGQVVRLGG